MPERTIDLEEAQERLPELLREAARGADVVLTEGGEPVARLVPIARAPGRRQFGSARGLIEIADDFDAPLEQFGE